MQEQSAALMVFRLDQILTFVNRYSFGYRRSAREHKIPGLPNYVEFSWRRRQLYFLRKLT